LPPNPPRNLVPLVTRTLAFTNTQKLELEGSWCVLEHCRVEEREASGESLTSKTVSFRKFSKLWMQRKYVRFVMRLHGVL
jgi:hypothetical protein